MLYTKQDEDVRNVFGITYGEAKESMEQLEQLLIDRNHIPFESYEACKQFAEQCNLHHKAYLHNRFGYVSVNHIGELLIKSEWIDQYSHVLFYLKPNDKGEMEESVWLPDPLLSKVSARTPDERGTDTRKPLYRRNYFLPRGYFDATTQTFNTASPFKYPAEETGADTSFIYTYIENIAGECAPWLLTWLREKMIHPDQKTQIIPVFTGEEGTGKSAFCDCLCSALFGEDNVVVSDKIDLTRNFNADHTDKLIVSIEEKMEGDNRNTASALKSSATASQVRKERKGHDATFQASYTEYVLTTNDPVPIKFDDKGDHRRFMIMETNPHFSRKGKDKDIADEVFTKLYGYDASGNEVTKGLFDVQERKVKNVNALKQFKYELFHKKYLKDQADIKLREFPKTDAFQRCFDTPRTTENLDVENIVRALAPFIEQTLIRGKLIDKVEIPAGRDETETINLWDIIPIGSMQYHHPTVGYGKAGRVYLNRRLIFQDEESNKIIPHAVVDRVLRVMERELHEEHGLLHKVDEIPPAGFTKLKGYARFAKGITFILDEEWAVDKDFISQEKLEEYFKEASGYGRAYIAPLEEVVEPEPEPEPEAPYVPREGIHRYNEFFKCDPDGEFENLNPMKEGTTDRVIENAVDWGDTFLLEADEPTLEVCKREWKKLRQVRDKTKPISAIELYRDRLTLQEQVAEELFEAGKVCRVVYSGGKSLHMLVRVKDKPSTKEERAWLDAHLKTTLTDKLVFDMQVKDVLRLTRAPIKKERTTRYEMPPQYECFFKPEELEDEVGIRLPVDIVGEQQLLLENWDNVLDINWRPMYDLWVTFSTNNSKYFKRNKVMPTKSVYKEASIAILEGTYFSSYKWTGMRQETFFPAYRLLRMTGWTHDEIWGEVRLQMKTYQKPTEVDYWLTRETCKLIQAIDQEVDNEYERDTDS